MEHTMSQTTRKETLAKLRRRSRNARLTHKGRLLDQAQELLGYPGLHDAERAVPRGEDETIA